jgi:hypothetical protein
MTKVPSHAYSELRRWHKIRDPMNDDLYPPVSDLFFEDQRADVALEALRDLSEDWNKNHASQFLTTRDHGCDTSRRYSAVAIKTRSARS